MASIMPAFDKFPKEGLIIGKLLAGYGELELELCYCVSKARNDFNMVFKSMFRPRGETQRIDIADAMGREPFHQLKQGTRFEEAIASVRYCLKIRNQFAHCYWTDDYGRQLGFVELEETAKQSPVVTDVIQIPANDIDLTLLREQEAYYVYTRDCLQFLNLEADPAAKKVPNIQRAAPKKVKRPSLGKP